MNYFYDGWIWIFWTSKCIEPIRVFFFKYSSDCVLLKEDSDIRRWLEGE